MIYNRSIRLGILLLIGCLYVSCNQSPNESNQFEVPYQEQVSIEVDGDIADWESLDRTFSVSSFLAPWPQGAMGKTVFKAVSDGTWVYFYFQAQDATPVLAPYSEEADVARGDRVEFFVSGDPELKQYYCAELAPNGRILDYQARFYREFDYAWNMQDLNIATRQLPDGYQVEGRFPVAFLKALDKQATDDSCTFWLGLYRADYFSLDAEDPDQVNWISWIDPKVEAPDFHIPSSFTQVQLRY